ncbi:Ribosomal RNA large subunit methyltransferase G [Pseudidiomarina piscicola]|uniref:Ribosomal RNA large subunit methyltransferase G n=1 Tax=Pseudidiomarina piscicola TaxID=2614830 RepID=A0A6S6WJR3_9GAMM|nr:methyltransferase [Pseudidiomarina piscicola]CAB0149658.1 Ribosomal RNA large subunit methyltransferase G [Pseudidiomarina piscicola]VZT39106.1 Ribosomal RNA large subunit methyltransferase G [Pseudomonas aeruginosa]
MEKSRHRTSRTSAAPTLLHTVAGRWQLRRYPHRTSDPLQAWDAADELLHTALINHEEETTSVQYPLLVNDASGALLMAVAHTQVTSSSASYISHLAQQANLELNQLDCQLKQIDPLAMAPPATDVVLMKLPKSQTLLEFQLAQLSRQLKPGTTLIAAARSRLFSPSVRELFSRYCDNLDISLIQRKSRVLKATIRQVANAPERFLNQWQVDGSPLTLRHYPGVFARNQLDIGARLLLDNLPPPGAQQVIDLGCGNGILGLSYALTSPQSAITWVDESYLAVASCQLNIDANLGSATHYQAKTDDCLSQQPSESVDLVLCNPPFHQENAITEHIARQMFRDARRVLRKGGEMRLVANRHLPYYHSLKRLFSQVHQQASNAKFVVYRCQN